MRFNMRGKELISIGEMTKKIEAGLKAKRDSDFIINAAHRCDLRSKTSPVRSSG